VEAEDVGGANPKLDLLAEATYERAIIGRELSRPPLALFDETSPRFLVCLGEAVEDPRIPVPHHDRAAKRADSAEGFTRLRPERHISEAHELVQLFALELCDNCLERRQVAVDV
jgi:hypothetical protein